MFKSTVHKDAGTKASRPTRKRGSVQTLQVDDASDSSSEDHLEKKSKVDIDVEIYPAERF